MQRQIQTLNVNSLTEAFGGFDAIIDVRAPSEYAIDHIPGAINLPVLDDQERAAVGTLYKQVDPFAARKLGARLVSTNIAHHLERLADHPKSWRPLLYCWRGGQRSGSLALILHEIGWPCVLLQGGYKAYRRAVQQSLSTASQYRWRVLTGPTGSGKTEILKTMAGQGFQVLDLEGLANHRGSILGQEPGASQPTQRHFESLVAKAMSGFSRSEPVWVESESSKIGQLHLPKDLFQAIVEAPALALTAERDARATFSLSRYTHLTEDVDAMHGLIDQLAFRHSRAQIARWHAAIDTNQWLSLSQDLLEMHYDPAYSRSQNRLQIQRSCQLSEPGRLDANLLTELQAMT